MLDRRHLIKGAGVSIFALGSGTALGSFGALALDTVTMPFENGERPLVKYPQKRPMIGLTSRPPQLETPFSVFDEGAITPNDAFFVRYHLAGGYGFDPAMGKMDTFGSLTAIKVSATIDAIVHGKPFAANVQQIDDLRMQVTGGEMKKLGDWFVLVFGQKFPGPLHAERLAGRRPIHTALHRADRCFQDRGDERQTGRHRLSAADHRAARQQHRRHGHAAVSPARFIHVPAVRRHRWQTGLAAYGGVFLPGPDRGVPQSGLHHAIGRGSPGERRRRLVRTVHEPLHLPGDPGLERIGDDVHDVHDVLRRHQRLLPRPHRPPGARYRPAVRRLDLDAGARQQRHVAASASTH